jgi:hypothetical protein
MNPACRHGVATGMRSCNDVGSLLPHHPIINPIQTLP